MKKGFICCLLILLASNYIYCCPTGKVLVNNQCEKCVPPSVISSDYKSCDISCKKNEFIQSQGSHQICVQECKKFVSDRKYCKNDCLIFDPAQNHNACLNYQQYFKNIVIFPDENQYLKECLGDNNMVIQQDKNQCAFCDEKTHLIIEINQIFSCVKKCKYPYIFDDNYQCIPPSDCTGFIHFEKNKCEEKCQGITFLDQTQSQKYCSNKCSQFTIIPLNRCTENIADCQNYFMSVDGRSCDSKCNLPDILKEGKCVTNTECSGYYEILDQTTDQIECKNKGHYRCACQLQSSDGRRCVNSCFLHQIEKQQPPYSICSRRCEDYCKHPKKFFITYQNNAIVRGCKESISVSENKEVIIQLLLNINNTNEFEQIKSELTDFMSSYSVNDPQKVAELLQMLKELAGAFFSTLLKDNLSQVKNNVHCIGSNSNAKVCFQLIGKWRSIKKSFDIQSIMINPSLDLTEINHRNIDSDQNGIMIFLKNKSYCKKDICTDFPVVQIDYIDLRHNRNLAVQGLDLYAIFPKKQSFFEQYLCSHYQEDLTNIKEKSTPQINKLTFSCPLNGPTSIEIVNNQDDWSERLNIQKSVLIFFIISVVIA